MHSQYTRIAGDTLHSMSQKHSRKSPVARRATPVTDRNNLVPLQQVRGMGMCLVPEDAYCASCEIMELFQVSPHNSEVARSITGRTSCCFQRSFHLYHPCAQNASFTTTSTHTHLSGRVYAQELSKQSALAFPLCPGDRQRL